MSSSLLPLLLSTLWGDRTNIMNWNVEPTIISPCESLFPEFYKPLYRKVEYDRGVLDFYNNPWIDVLGRKSGDIMSVGTDKDNFKVLIDVHQFKPEEVTVRLKNRYLIIETNHKVINISDLVLRQYDSNYPRRCYFTRRYQLPERVDIDQVTVTMSSDGILTITAPLKEMDQEKIIKIELTGQPALRRDNEDQEPITQASATTSSTEKKTESENEGREELTMQGQQEDTKPEK